MLARSLMKQGESKTDTVWRARCTNGQIMKTLITLLALSLAACAPIAPPMHPTRSVVQVQDVVKIALKEINLDILEFTVWNNGKQPLVVDRDGIVLITDQGARKRLPGGIAHSYTLQPGTAHEVNVRYDWSGLKNQLVRVSFDGALTVNGKPLDVSPIEIRVW
jgi:hypothetical protein